MQTAIAVEHAHQGVCLTSRQEHRLQVEVQNMVQLLISADQGLFGLLNVRSRCAATHLTV